MEKAHEWKDGVGLAERIVRRCVEVQCSPPEACEAAHSRKSMISDLRSGRIMTIRADTLYELSEVLRCSCNWLMSGREFAFEEHFTNEERDLIRAWRLCTDEERESIAFLLRAYGMPMPQPKIDETAV